MEAFWSDTYHDEVANIVKSQLVLQLLTSSDLRYLQILFQDSLTVANQEDTSKSLDL